MHPAASVILFTTLSGAGYGVLALLAGLALAGAGLAGTGLAGAGLPQGWPAALALAGALVFVSGGLLASLAHLGRPERAWRAVTQIGSSWLSREGVLALLTYPAALLFGYGLLATPFDGWWWLAALALLLLTLATVFATGMIYASLKPIAAWRHGLVVPGYLLFAALSGALWLLPLDLATGMALQPGLGLAVPLLCLAGALLKILYWRGLDRQAMPSTAAALGLPEMTGVNVLDPPQTGSGYLQREMGFRVARKHARRLRRLTVLAGFLLPAVLAVLALLPVGAGTAVALALLAALLAQAGLLLERGLFFAEARHTVMLYYDAPPAR